MFYRNADRSQTVIEKKQNEGRERNAPYDYSTLYFLSSAQSYRERSKVSGRTH